jgi:hypothetical protein
MSRVIFPAGSAGSEENAAQKEKGQNRVKLQFYPRVIVPQLKHFAGLRLAVVLPIMRNGGEGLRVRDRSVCWQISSLDHTPCRGPTVL